MIVFHVIFVDFKTLWIRLEAERTFANTLFFVTQSLLFSPDPAMHNFALQLRSTLSILCFKVLSSFPISSSFWVSMPGWQQHKQVEELLETARKHWLFSHQYLYHYFYLPHHILLCICLLRSHLETKIYQFKAESYSPSQASWPSALVKYSWLTSPCFTLAWSVKKLCRDLVLRSVRFTIIMVLEAHFWIL